MSDDASADVIVVGAGPAGAACAYVLACAGSSVVLIDRGVAPGSKNVSGGRLYTGALDVLDVGLAARVPSERRVISERIALMDSSRSLQICARPPARHGGYEQSVTVMRATFDAWLAGLAEEAGATMVPGITVSSLVRDGNGAIRGIVADGDELLADVVVAADGTNSLLTREVGVVSAPVSGQVATGVKEVIKLSVGAIEDRFGVGAGEGVAQLMVGCTRGLHGGGFLYTNKTSVSLGVVVDPGGLARIGATPRDLLEDLRAHPSIVPLLRDGEVVEYSAHLVREDGVAGVPDRLTAPGFLVTGEAAGFILNLGYTIRGMDLAILSGIAAARAILFAGRDEHLLERAYRREIRDVGLLGIMTAGQGYPAFLESDRVYADYPALALAVADDIFGIPDPSAVSPPRRIVPQIRRRLRDAPIRTRDLLTDAHRAWKGV